MTKILKGRIKKVGLPPGTLVHIGDYETSKIHISIIDYDAQKILEKKDASINDCMIYLGTPAITWININGIHDPKVIESFGRHFGLHPLLLEDVMNSGQRSKLDDYKDNIFIVARVLKYNEEKEDIEDEQLSIVLGRNYLITFVESSTDLFNPIRERLHAAKSRIRQRGADYLCYSLLDCLVDNYFLILEKVDENLENLEEKLVINTPKPEVLQKIQHSKRVITLLRKSVWPMREVLSNFRRLETPLIQDSTKLYIQDVYDHTIQAIDTIESFRDLASGMLDIYMSNISQKMNEIMKVLTIMATIFVPLTFIASVYGMNFEMIPELHWKWGYPTVLLFMLLVSLGMIYYFKRKKWI